MTALTPAFVLIALVVSAAAGPIPGRQAPFAVAKRDHSAGPVVAAKVLSNDQPKASLPDVGVNPNPAPRLSSRLFGGNTKYTYNFVTGKFEEETTHGLLDVDVGHGDDDHTGALLDVDILRRQTTGDITSPGAAEGDVPHEAHMMRSRAFRATVNKKLAKAKSGAKNTATQKMKTVASTPGQVKAVVAPQHPAVTPSTDSTTTMIVPEGGSLLDVDVDLGHAPEAAVASQAVAAAPAAASAAVAPPVASAASTAGSATANSGNSALVFNPKQISSTKFAKSGAPKVHAVTGQDASSVTGQDASSVTDAAAPAATKLYTATHGGLLGVDLDVL